jgi:16S rRNA (guanine527-N7)-methyltransferase
VPDDQALVASLCQGERTLGISLTPEQRDRLIAYIKLIVKWNRVYNLTAVRDPQRMLDRHILDSLSVLPYLPGSRIIDVGAGAGLPGIPLAIACPDKTFVLLDSNRKKTRFMQQAKIELALGNIEVVCDRVENYQPAERFDAVISRAFSSLLNMVSWSAHLCAPHGVLLAMKGSYPEEEMAELAQHTGPTNSLEIKAVHNLHRAGAAAQRYLVEIKAPKSSNQN